MSEGKRWSPIETAPKDGTRLLVHIPAGAFQDGKHPYDKHTVIGYWWKGDNLNSPRWRSSGANQPTHWMSLPLAPTGD